MVYTGSLQGLTIKQHGIHWDSPGTHHQPTWNTLGLFNTSDDVRNTIQLDSLYSYMKLWFLTYFIPFNEYDVAYTLTRFFFHRAQRSDLAVV